MMIASTSSGGPRGVRFVAQENLEPLPLRQLKDATSDAALIPHLFKAFDPNSGTFLPGAAAQILVPAGRAARFIATAAAGGARGHTAEDARRAASVTKWGKSRRRAKAAATATTTAAAAAAATEVDEEEPSIDSIAHTVEAPSASYSAHWG